MATALLLQLVDLVLVIAAIVAGALIVLAYCDTPGIKLANPFIDRRIIAFIFFLSLLLLVLRFAERARAFGLLFGDSARWWRLLPIVKLSMLSGAIAFITLAMFSPVGDRHLYILIDHEIARGASAVPELACKLVQRRAEWLAAGLPPSAIYIEPGSSVASRLNEIVTQLQGTLDGSGKCNFSSSILLLNEFSALAERANSNGSAIEERLRTIRKELSNRAGDEILVLSSLRSAPINWALNVRSGSSSWVNVSRNSVVTTASPIIQSYTIWHFPGLVPELEFEISIPVGASRENTEGGFDAPSITAFLTADSTKSCPAQLSTISPTSLFLRDVRPPSTAFDPREGESYGLEPSSVISIGEYPSSNGRRLAYDISFPSTGPDFLCVIFGGRGWSQFVGQSDQSNLLPKFGYPISVQKRSLTAQIDLDLQTGLASILSGGAQSSIDRSPIHAVTSAADADILITKSPVDGSRPEVVVTIAKEAPLAQERAQAVKSSIWQLELTQSYSAGRNSELGRFVRLTRSQRANHEGLDGAPDCPVTEVDRAKLEVYVVARNGEVCKVVLGQQVDTGHMQLHLPAASVLTGLQSDQKTAIKTLLIFAATVAWRSAQSDKQQAVERKSIDGNTQGDQSMGWATGNEPLWKQFVSALRGNLEDRLASNAENGLRSRWLSYGLLLFGLASLLGLVGLVPLFLRNLMDRGRE